MDHRVVHIDLPEAREPLPDFLVRQNTDAERRLTFDILVECDLGARQQADRNVRLADRRESAATGLGMDQPGLLESKSGNGRRYSWSCGLFAGCALRQQPAYAIDHEFRFIGLGKSRTRITKLCGNIGRAGRIPN